MYLLAGLDHTEQVHSLCQQGPRASAEETFTTFADDNGWGSVGLATLIGMVGPTTTYLGGDSAVHLAEELKDASYILPRAMFVAAIINCKHSIFSTFSTK